ncbi:alpha-farnesene synthase-like [Euphorbia lathyris]|uniref:alpha-farnesene synthase-like n=1 Tax=Euphorbia lathyris TaxID=212925 RepID=UPI00331337F1
MEASQINSDGFSMVQNTDSRRTANYKPNIWKHDFLLTLSSSFHEDKYRREVERLKEEVQDLFSETVDLRAKLELVDSIRKLGIGSYFGDEVKIALDTVMASFDLNMGGNLYITALSFRLLRLHGYDVSQGSCSVEGSGSQIHQQDSSMFLLMLISPVIFLLKATEAIKPPPSVMGGGEIRKATTFPPQARGGSGEEAVAFGKVLCIQFEDSISSGLHPLRQLHFISSNSTADLTDEGFEKDLRRMKLFKAKRDMGRKNCPRKYRGQIFMFLGTIFVVSEGVIFCSGGISMKTKSLDIASILELLEASHLAKEGESVLEDAKIFSTRILKSMEYSKLSKHVLHSLELPSHWRSEWFDVAWQIDNYQQEKNISTCLIDLAKVNFNIVQATLQKDLKDISRWWRNLDLIENMNFSRDRLVECFICTVGLGFEPKHSSLRKWLTKVVLMIIVIDDVYDVYGALEELQIFTNAVQRWEIGGEVKKLPECMQICLEALYKITNEMALEIHTQKGLDYVPTQFHLKKAWGDFCESLLIEAKWFNKGHTPSLKEYLNNGRISSSGSLLSVHSFFCIMDRVTQETMDFLGRNQDLIHNISLIIRLCNDLGTSVEEQERGDASSSILCYMKDMNVSEEAARKHIKGIVNNLWKKINGKCFTNISTDDQMQLFLNISTNMARVAHNLYQNGDGFGAQGHENKKQILSLLVHPMNLDH